ncbi:MAG TPA: hypothetical protein VH596_15415 [Terriglobales bacterium]|jgi:hypothetical protein
MKERRRWLWLFINVIFVAILLVPSLRMTIASMAATVTATSVAQSGKKDDDVTITSVASARKALREQIWGEADLPHTFPAVSVLKKSDPQRKQIIREMGLADLSQFRQVEKLSFALAAGQSAVGYHFVANGDSKRLVIVHQGHACTFGPSSMGLQRLVGKLLSNGYSVVTLYMPRPANCENQDMVSYHSELFKSVSGKLHGSPLQLFVGPALQTLNYAFKSGYSRVDMIGISGGGWTTTVYAAVDPRIKLSIPIAGTFPRHLPCGINVDDPEQDSIASYMNLYVLGSAGEGRRQIQVLNEYDSCCFKVKCDNPQRDNEPDIKNYEAAINRADHALGGGNFSVYIDRGSRRHQISAEVLNNVIIPALRD